ncbi:MAG: hypothetical protein H2184_13270 [Candidatus Galacturonibacter soehngenii]|nr:hypothetical protein [Candidatus Galacturonibacter soehngenii]
MRKYNLEPTRENILLSLKEDTISRNSELISMIKILEEIEGNFFIALDGEWGTGKTFFVKQLELILNYLRQKMFEEEFVADREIESIIENSNKLKNLNLEQGYFVHYYNAWLYDNHTDPMLSIIYSILKDWQFKANTTISQRIKNNIVQVLKSVQFWNIGSIGTAIENLNGTDILQEIGTLEETKVKIKEIFDEIINERCNRLIIVIDELDRCNPNYAVSLLERLKHFFDDDRIIFLLSINKSQLIHTISNCYGTNFDSTGYLNKFFDFNLKMNKVDSSKYVISKGVLKDDRFILNKMGLDMLNYMNFSMRDASIYINQINFINEKVNKESYNSEYLFISLFLPIVVAFRISDVQKSNLIENGNGEDILNHIIENNTNLQRLILRLDSKEGNEEERLERSKLEYFKIYDFLTKGMNNKESHRFDIDWDFKNYFWNLVNSYCK